MISFKNGDGSTTAEQCSIYTQNYKNQSSQHIALLMIHPWYPKIYSNFLVHIGIEDGVGRGKGGGGYTVMPGPTSD